mgnify:CR=1 FL=1
MWCQNRGRNLENGGGRGFLGTLIMYSLYQEKTDEGVGNKFKKEINVIKSKTS